ncbi:MAG: GrpB family protein [Simkaniaceae bacterium]|nr:GrpB family protein [Simkaniaceae bacterium]
MSKYVFKPYSVEFAQRYNRERARIFAAAPECCDVQHVGSTAVVGLGGKGIVDIAIAADDPMAVCEKLQAAGYDFRKEYSTDGRLFLKSGDKGVHLHLCPTGSHELRGLILFRDYLRANPDKCAEYAQLKERAAQEANADGAIYRKIKAPFFAQALADAQSSDAPEE